MPPTFLFDAGPAVAKILVRFWLLRFVQVFLLAAALLGAVEWLQRRDTGFGYASVATWAALSALATASLSAWWAYKRQCKMVFKDRA